MRLSCACLLLAARLNLMSRALVSLSCAQVYVLRRVHAHARVVLVPALGCLHMLGVTYACLFDARVGICDQGSTRACACAARACSWVSSHAWCHLCLFI
jgi:hypothetical protein